MTKNHEPRPHFKPLGKFGALNVKIDESEVQAKFGFPLAAITAYRANFEKSYLTQLWSELSHSCTQIEALDVWFLGKLTSLIDSKYSERYQWNGEQMSFVRKWFQHN